MQKKNIIFLSISLVLIILLGIGVSYSMWNVSVSQDTNNTAYTECFDLSITNKENNINLDNAYPISNDKGKSLTPYTFTVTNTCDITTQYNINLEVLNNSTLSSKFIDVMFESNINLLSSYDSTDKVNTSSIESRKLTTGILKSQESKDYSLRLWIDYNTTLEDLDNEIKTFKSKIVVVGKPINYTGDTVFNFDYTGGEQTFTAPVSGTYKIELWGAQGGNNGGNGAYTSGTIKLSRGLNVYTFVGGNGSENLAGVAQNIKGGYNGGGLTKGQDCCNRVFGTGGGATDVRLSNGDFADFNSLKSRIMVAAGGGGRFSDGSGNDYRSQDGESSGGSGGGLMGVNGSGYYSDYCYGLGALQTSGGKIGSSSTARYCKSGTNSGYTDPDLITGTFGIGGSHGSQGNNGTGGGGGYYGGSSSGHIASAGGGSSFISGHNGCDAIKEESTENNIIHTGQSIHYSGLYFTNTLMIDGDGYRWTTKKEEQIGMPSHSDNSIIMGNSGNGYARITLISID